MKKTVKVTLQDKVVTLKEERTLMPPERDQKWILRNTWAIMNFQWFHALCLLVMEIYCWD